MNRMVSLINWLRKTIIRHLKARRHKPTTNTEQRFYLANMMVKNLNIILASCLLSLVTNFGLSKATNFTGSTSSSSSSTLALMTDKLLTKLKTHLATIEPPKSRGYDYGYGFLDGYSTEVHGKSDYTWIVPLILVIGFGTLLIPLLGTLMTTMMTQGTINLTAGRRRKRNAIIDDLFRIGNSIDFQPAMKLLEDAFKRFEKNH